MKRKGLERQRWIESIDDFVRQYGRATPRWAIFLTYDLTMTTLARAVLPTLSRRGRQFRSVILADQGALEQALSVAGGSLPGAVNIHPVRCKRGGVFHPKLVLLRAGRHVRACFGSANITDGGLGSNLEIWTQTESPDVLAGLQQFLGEIVQSHDLAVDDGARRSIKRALCGLPQEPSKLVWSSLDGSFANRLRNGTESNAKRATIISPMYAGAGGIKAARRAIPATSIDLYTTANVPVPSSKVFVYAPAHPADQTEEDPDAFPRTLHAKAYLLQPAGRGETIAWIGSANFTAQALTKSVAKGGNVELMVRTILPADELRAVSADLTVLFKARDKADVPDEFEPTPPPGPIATVLACELVGGPDAPRLVVFASIKSGKVQLEHASERVLVTIRAGRGVVANDALRRFLPDLELTAAQVLVIYQRLGKMKVPVVVNVPHVPTAEGAGSHTSVDALLDDLLGRIRIPTRRLDADNDQADEGDDDADEIDADEQAAEIGRRLDEVVHQGELDRLAVKAAMLKKLAIASAAAGFERDGLMSEILGALYEACPPHLSPSLRSLFNDLEPNVTA